jgi:death-on-curing family protein
MTKESSQTGEVLIYQTPDGGTAVDVRLEQDTVWLTQRQMGDLFGTTPENILMHLRNIYENKELAESPTSKDFLVVRLEGKRQVKRELKHYNLDAIISVGYRVNSKQGTQFRIWANQVLKDYLVKGYALNEKRLKQQNEQIQELEKTLKLFQNVVSDTLSQHEATGLLRVITDYTQTFILLNQYDSSRLSTEALNLNITYEIQLDEALSAIEELKSVLIDKNEATPLFGNRKDESFAGVLGNIVQSFGGEYLYPSIEEQAANLLYMVIKNHPFTDGNKRIGAFLFIWFLERNKHNLKTSGEAKINDNALTALALLVAQSDPRQKDIMIQLIINLIRG